MTKISFITITARSDYPYIGRPELRIFEPMLESLKRQTMNGNEFVDFEWIIVDTLWDERKDYFTNRSDRGDIKFKIKHVPARPNMWHDNGLAGICTQYNKGIIYADGELLYFGGEGYMMIHEFCEKLWGYYKKGYIPLVWYFFDNTFTPKDLIEKVPTYWRKAYPEEAEDSPVPYNICGYTGKNIIIEHRPIYAFKNNNLEIYDAEWGWFFGCSGAPLEGMLKINGFDQRCEGDRMLLDCDVGSRLDLLGYKKFGLFRDLFVIRAKSDFSVWNPKLIKSSVTIKCNYALIWHSRMMMNEKKDTYRANTVNGVSDEDIKWMKDKWCGTMCPIREQCRTEHPWQFPFEHKEGYGHSSSKKWFDFWRTHVEKIDLVEERNKRLSGDIKYKEGTFI